MLLINGVDKLLNLQDFALRLFESRLTEWLSHNLPL